MLKDYLMAKKALTVVGVELDGSDEEAFEIGWDIMMGGVKVNVGYMPEVYEKLADAMVTSIVNDVRFIERNSMGEEVIKLLDKEGTATEVRLIDIEEGTVIYDEYDMLENEIMIAIKKGVIK